MESAFTETKKDQIMGWVRENDSQALREYIMNVYREPLRIYYLGCKNLEKKDVDEAVESFLTSICSKEGGIVGYLDGWLKREPIPRLRKYLINGLLFALRTQRAKQSRESDRRAPEKATFTLEELESSDAEPGVEFDRSYIQSLVRYALVQAERRCTREGFVVHWTVFVRHLIQEETYPDIAKDLGITASQAAVMCRTGKLRFVQEFCGLVERDGGSRESCEETIRTYLEIIGS